MEDPLFVITGSIYKQHRVQMAIMITETKQ